jgi:hypothetical protein
MLHIPTAELQRMVQDAYGCGSAFVAVVPVVARMGKQACLVAVTVLRLLGHASAKYCYAWSKHVEHSDRAEFRLILGDADIRSPECAIQREYELPDDIESVRRIG